jgi:hypothetical protein
LAAASADALAARTTGQGALPESIPRSSELRTPAARSVRSQVKSGNSRPKCPVYGCLPVLFKQSLGDEDIAGVVKRRYYKKKRWQNKALA